jgi:4,5-DOPA dioxygenase extradiol
MGESGDLMPVVFVGHGNPMNAISNNAFTEGWRSISAAMPRPDSILCVSAHWYVRGTRVTINQRPPTIHDFGGFPRELYEVEYPAPGNPDLARRVETLLGPSRVQLDGEWGLDHGTWSVLTHMFPKADVPVIQLSLDGAQPGQFHYDLGKRLAPLRDEGVLVLASGNIVHNLHAYSWGGRQAEPYDWALEFERKARKLIAAHNHMSLVDYESLGEPARLSAPTPDHYLPLLYALSLCRPKDSLSFPVEGFDGGSISMLAVRIG